MALQFSPNAGLPYPQHSDRNWDAALVATILRLDAMAPLGPLSVRATNPDTAGLPTDLSVTVAAGTVMLARGTTVAVAGGAVTVTPSATTHIWATPAGAVASGASWPSTAHAKLATVSAGSAAVTPPIVDERVAYRVALVTAPSSVAALTDSTGGTAGSTLLATGDATTNNNFASLAAKVEAIRAALTLLGLN